MKKFYLKFYLLVIATTLIGNLSFAQSYTYSMFTDTYTELVNPTIVTSNLTGTAYITNINNMQFTLYNETFAFNGTSGLAIGENGFISATNTSGNRAFAFDALLGGLANHTNGSEISYVVDNSTNGHILKVQYKNMGVSTGSSSDFLNFQVWVYHATGDIEYRYGPSSTGPNTFGVGVSGPAVGIFLAENDFSQVYETQFLVGNASNPTVDTLNTFAPITGTPSDGTVYRFSSNNTVSTPEYENVTFSLFPNPAKDVLTINSNKKLSKVEVIDILGKTVLNTETLVNNTLNIASLKRGLYMIRMYTDDKILIEKFMKQ